MNNKMRKFVLYTLIFAMIATIGCGPKVDYEAKKAYNRGVDNFKIGQYDQAISDFSKAIEINPRFAMAYNHRGIVYDSKGQYDKAISDYTKAIEINPKYAEAYNNRAVSYYYKGEYDKAWEDVHKAQSLGHQVHPGFLKALRGPKGVAFASKGKFKEAKAEFEKALKIDPFNGSAKRLLKVIEDVANKKIENKTAIHFFKGVDYADKGLYDESISGYNKAIEINPQYADAYNNRGVTFSLKGDYDRAIADYNKALEINPQYADAYHNRGLTKAY